MPRKCPAALARCALAPALVLTLALAACGGGSTAGPIARTPATTTAPVPPARTAPGAVPSTTAPAPAAGATTPAPAPDPAPEPAPRGRTRSSGGAVAPAGADTGSTAAAADEPPTTPAQPPRTTPAPAPRPAGSPLDERADLILTRRASPVHYFQQGTVTGTYDGTMAVEARITSRGVLVSFTATLPGGTISGRGVAVAILDSTTWPALRGTAIVTGGTGRFAGIHGRRLSVGGRARPDASHARVRLTGTVTY